jgi:heme exporter protein C
VPLTFSAPAFPLDPSGGLRQQNAEAQGGFDIIGESMRQTLTFSMVAFSVLFSALLIIRWRLLRMEDELAELREDLA